MTWYTHTGANMANGQQPHAGAAACSSILPMGTVVHLFGKNGQELTVTCKDRGHLNSQMWLDIFCEDEDCGRHVARNFSPYAYAAITRR